MSPAATVSRTLRIIVRFHAGRFSGSPEWPPSPARLFQALVAATAAGETIDEASAKALRAFERFPAPIIRAPRTETSRGFVTYVPNNDLDTVGGDPDRISEVRVGKTIRDRLFDADLPLVYEWAEFPADRALERDLATIAAGLYQLGRGVDMAWAVTEFAEEDPEPQSARFQQLVTYRPTGGDGVRLSAPTAGTFDSLVERWSRMRGRFRAVRDGRKSKTAFAQPPKPLLREVGYEAPPVRRQFDLRDPTARRRFAPLPARDAPGIVETIRDAAARRLSDEADPSMAALVERFLVGRGAGDADKERRVRILPLPSIGHPHAEQSIRRILLEVPRNCPIPHEDVAWAFSGLSPFDATDPGTGEATYEGAILSPAPLDAMALRYTADDARARTWRSVTPVALRARRRRIDPKRRSEEAKGGAERAGEEQAALADLRRALRLAGVDAQLVSARLQREPFDPRGERAERFATPRFEKERLWHAEMTLSRPVCGPLTIGDGRFLGLGLFRPLRDETEASVRFVPCLDPDRVAGLDPEALSRAFRRAVMARVGRLLGEGRDLPPYFTGHAADGAPLRDGRHRHLAFVWSTSQAGWLVIPPHCFERRRAVRSERQHAETLAEALDALEFVSVPGHGRVGAARPGPAPDALIGVSDRWRSVSPYRVTRHDKKAASDDAVAADIAAECRRRGFPLRRAVVTDAFKGPRGGLSGYATLEFEKPVCGPIVLGRSAHLGGGLFQVCD